MISKALDCRKFRCTLSIKSLRHMMQGLRTIALYSTIGRTYVVTALLVISQLPVTKGKTSEKGDSLADNVVNMHMKIC